MRDKELCEFIAERWKILQRKTEGKPRPWTKDPILDTYRFCNVMREDDKVSKWIAQNWRNPNAGLEDLWFAMVVARLFNLPDTLKHIGFPIPWKPERVRRILHLRKSFGLNNFNAAYIVSTNGIAMDKVDYLFERVLSPLWADRKKLRPKAGDTLEAYHAMLCQYQGLGSFIAAQVVADLKYVQPLLDASDWASFAAPGPGSKRGLNRVYGRQIEASWPGRTWQVSLAELHSKVRKRLPNLPLHAQDLQNCLCEFDKYERARLGEGTPKQLYKEA